MRVDLNTLCFAPPDQAGTSVVDLRKSTFTSKSTGNSKLTIISKSTGISSSTVIPKSTGISNSTIILRSTAVPKSTFKVNKTVVKSVWRRLLSALILGYSLFLWDGVRRGGVEWGGVG